MTSYLVVLVIGLYLRTKREWHKGQQEYVSSKDVQIYDHFIVLHISKDKTEYNKGAWGVILFLKAAIICQDLADVIYLSSYLSIYICVCVCVLDWPMIHFVLDNIYSCWWIWIKESIFQFKHRLPKMYIFLLRICLGITLFSMLVHSYNNVLFKNVPRHNMHFMSWIICYIYIKTSLFIRKKTIGQYYSDNENMD